MGVGVGIVVVGVLVLLLLRPGKPNWERRELVFFNLVQPKNYSPEAFTNALRQRLTPEEASLVVNPLEGNPTMVAE